MDETVEKYKQTLFKLWKQSCANPSLKINFLNNRFEIKDKIVKLNVKDNFINDIISKAFRNSFKSVDWNTYDVNDACYYFNVEKKKLSISKILVNVNCANTISFLKKETSLFSSKEKIVEVNADFNNYNKGQVDAILGRNSEDIINFNGAHTGYGTNLKYQIYFALLTYNNIFIPITLKEYEELRCYELECRKKEDMEDVYRNLTLLSPSEYKEFLMWKESQRIYSENDSQKNLENAE